MAEIMAQRRRAADKKKGFLGMIGERPGSRWRSGGRVPQNAVSATLKNDIRANNPLHLAGLQGRDRMQQAVFKNQSGARGRSRFKLNGRLCALNGFSSTLVGQVAPIAGGQRLRVGQKSQGA